MNTVDVSLRTFSIKTKIISAVKGIFVNKGFYLVRLTMYGNPIGLVSKNKVCFASPNLDLVDANNEKLLPFQGNLCIS